MVARGTVAVDERLRQRVRARPEDFGLPPRASEARVFAKLIEVGARVVLEERRDAERSKEYAEWADDPERRAAIRDAMEMAIEDGLLY